MAIKKYGDWRDGASFPAFLWAMWAAAPGMVILMIVCAALALWLR